MFNPWVLAALGMVLVLRHRSLDLSVWMAFSLGSVVALMFWIYISSLIILFGAHLSAAVAGHASSRLDTRSHGPG